MTLFELSFFASPITGAVCGAVSGRKGGLTGVGGGLALGLVIGLATCFLSILLAAGLMTLADPHPLAEKKGSFLQGACAGVALLSPVASIVISGILGSLAARAIFG